MKHMNITYSVNGWVEQQIYLTTDEYTPEQVMEMLQTGEMITSLSAGGPLVLVKNNEFKEIGEVVNSTLEGGDMFDFELDFELDNG